MAPAERIGPEDEKITVNLSPVDLGRIDLLVREGVFSSRTDLIRDAVRRQLEVHAKLIGDVVVHKSYGVGALAFGKKDLEEMRAKGEKVRIRVVGLCVFGPGITASLAADTVESISVLGSVRGPKDVVAWAKAQMRGTS